MSSRPGVHNETLSAKKIKIGKYVLVILSSMLPPYPLVAELVHTSGGCKHQLWVSVWSVRYQHLPGILYVPPAPQQDS